MTGSCRFAHPLGLEARLFELVLQLANVICRGVIGHALTIGTATQSRK